MRLLQKIKTILKPLITFQGQLDPSSAYNIWATTYDEQINNPIVFLNKLMFQELLTDIKVEGKKVIDIGCGTGSLWEIIYTKKPKELIGYEISIEMLKRLQEKYPLAKTYLAQDSKLKELQDESYDLIISTLVIGYIKDLAMAFTEWNRVLKKDGEIIITDLHPDFLKKGAKRTFTSDTKVINIKNYIHSEKHLKEITKKLGWIEIKLLEKSVDKTIRHFFEKNNSLRAYQESINTPILSGYHFKKK